MAERVSSKTDLWKSQFEFNENLYSELNEIQEMMNSMVDMIRGLNKSICSQNFQSDHRTTEFELSQQLKNSNRYDLLKIPKIDFPIFYGVRPREWVRDCEQYFIIHAVSDDIKLRLGELHLRGEAELWLIGWKLNNSSMSMSWESLKDEVCNRFEVGALLVDEFGQQSPLKLEGSGATHNLFEKTPSLHSMKKTEAYDLVPTARHSFSSVSLIRNERNDDSVLNRADYCKFDEVLGPFSVKHNTRIDIQEVLEPPTFDLLKILGCDFINSNGLNRDFDKMASNLNVDFGVDGILMFVFDPGGNSSLQMDLFIDRDVCEAVLGRPCVISSLLVILQWKSILNAAMDACKALKQDGLVVIGGVASNTAAAQLAETFAEAKCPTKVVGVPVTLNGDLKNQFVKANVGFDTICKVNSQLTSNVCTDAFSAERYYYFIRFRGRRASHVALE